MLHTERREFDRINLARPCKVFDRRTGKYVAGTTLNLSSGGAMLELSRPVDLAPGDHLFLGVALTRRQSLLPSKEMIDCHVVRSANATGRSTGLALRFSEPIEQLPQLERIAA